MNERPGATLIEVLVVLVLILFLTFSLCAGWGFVYEVPFTVLFGWPKYLWRVIPQLQPDPWTVATGIVCLAGFILGSHAFLRWLHSARALPPDPAHAGAKAVWPWKRTLQLVGIVVLMFVAGIATTGMVHQTGWLIRSPEPLLGEVTPRNHSLNNLKQMVLAAASYRENETTPYLPQSTFDGTGRPMHSWQTSLLPYLEQANLYHQIDRTKSWDDPANAAVMATPIKVFLQPSIPFDHANSPAASHYAGNVLIVLGSTPKNLGDLPNGIENTILAGEVSADFRTWGNPLNARDPRLGGEGRPGGFGGPKGKPAQMGMLDGSVRTFDPQMLAEAGQVPE